ncbi:hypothetical protein SDC9_141813 [bioreactor metagenome]|uniref:Uncharacterized protein n=1 Tax=bioreactor metagenome TaxID=1076179 RepID=A0A645DZC4_9ZZZZ
MVTLRHHLMGDGGPAKGLGPAGLIKADEHKGLDAKPKRVRLHVGVVAANDSRRFEGSDSGGCRRSRQVDFKRHLRRRSPSVLVKYCQYVAVDVVHPNHL